MWGLEKGGGFDRGWALKDRYELEDMVEQDASGVTFRARDRETDQLVSLRRFFPMDSPGSGFVEEEGESYTGTVEALKLVRHPSLCGVLDGGVDEVDGIPYLITEWAEGERLAALMERGPLTAEQAVAVAGQGLEVLMLLGEVFGEGLEWLEVEPGAVVVNEETGLCRFSICPLQVLGVAKRDGGVKGLGWLVEVGMGWDGRMVPPGAAAGLGGWVAKAKGSDCSVAEAYRGIVTVRSVWTGEVVPELAGPTLIQIAAAARQRPVVSAPMRTYTAPSSGGAGKVLALVFGGVVLLGVGIWLGVEQPWATPVVAQAGPPRVEHVPLKEAQAKPRGLTAQEKIDQRVKETSAAMGMVVEDKKATPKTPGPVAQIERPKEDEPEPEPEADPEPVKPKVFGPEDGAALRDWIGEEVVLEAVLLRVRDSTSGKTRYLEFSDEVGQDVVCGRCWPDSGMELKLLKELEGKKLRFSGTAAVEAGTGRIVVHLAGMGDIEEI